MQLVSVSHTKIQEDSIRKIGQIPSKLPKWNMDQWESANGSMKDGSTEIGFDIDDRSMKSTFGQAFKSEEGDNIHLPVY